MTIATSGRACAIQSRTGPNAAKNGAKATSSWRPAAMVRPMMGTCDVPSPPGISAMSLLFPQRAAAGRRAFHAVELGEEVHVAAGGQQGLLVAAAHCGALFLAEPAAVAIGFHVDRKSTRLNSSH